ncbi:MAG TPA: 2-amino-4-hydroxy-6-hydroxymethyldihydropteridine diphosphokinase [Acetobacteraceae bacterium]|nr:2-amino-4-hydroxy-6-hydroxymethyldihydropteridine diphosphokinase [Acetobacteraceae bacterium]
MILIAIGANLPGKMGEPPIGTCRAAALALEGLAGLRLRALSRWYRTAPVPRSDQPDYVNGVAHLEGEAEPAALLGALLSIEAAAGRERSVPNAARRLDLDIIAMGAVVRDGPDPVLPHPRAHERGFVLLPLRDVAPDWVHPRLGLSVDALIAALPLQPIHVL